MTPLLSHSLCEYLRRHGYGDDVVSQFGVNMEEFKQTYNQIEKRIHGLTIDFDKLIENDHLISQGNLAILRLDDIYSEVIQAWRESNKHDIDVMKHTTNPASTTNRSDRKEKIERTHKTNPPDPNLVNQAIEVTLAACRIQATITHRRDQLKIAQITGIPIGGSVGQALPNKHRNNAQPQDNSRELASISGPKSQPEASARNAVDNEDLIDPTESLNESLDHETKIQKLSPLSGYTKINGYKSLIPIEPDPQPNCQHNGAHDIVKSPPQFHPADPRSSVFIPANTNFPTPNQRQAHNYARVRNEVPHETVLVTPTPDFSDIPGYTEAIRKLREEDEQEKNANTLAQSPPNTS